MLDKFLKEDFAVGIALNSYEAEAIDRKRKRIESERVLLMGSSSKAATIPSIAAAQKCNPKSRLFTVNSIRISLFNFLAFFK